MTNDKKPPQTITFTVDNVEFTVSEKHQTAGTILALAGLDPATYDLAKLHGDGEAFKDDQQVIVQDGDAFATVRTCAPVA
ncbi:hypothetical protein QI633_27200 (plasmid) [Nocardioides sp. QY071]|uniref:hypothetical protein n=1 Tax=Nocardioides sp. QY071 TaxID=3044187 RepID=UPI002499FD21|nr:hypothetical protein [Nocardioides sp. QY071]WGY04951.1 hypothetical protein QI633_27200 [Nocardioides sp. QY071]